MKNLGKVIDRLIDLDSEFKVNLLPIKRKWARHPSHSNDYWQELVNFLNTDNLLKHPKRDKIANIVMPKKRPQDRRSTLIDVCPGDIVIGPIPENIAGKLQKYDRQCIQLALKKTEVHLTRDPDLAREVARKEAVLDIDGKKIWLEIRDTFNLWGRMDPLGIRKRDGMIVLVQLPMEPPHMPPQGFPGGVQGSIINLDPDMMRQIFRMLNLRPPPGMLPGDDNE